MNCQACDQYDREENYCAANLFEREYPLACLLKMVIQELRLLHDEEGEEWKYE